MSNISYDIVIDNGSLEHCFNIGNAFFNCIKLVNEGGIIFHINPLAMGNHGFYNLNPTLYYDLYSQNGFKVLEIFGVGSNSDKVYQLPPTNLFQMHKLNEPCKIVVISQKIANKSALNYPVQTKYKNFLS